MTKTEERVETQRAELAKKRSELVAAYESWLGLTQGVDSPIVSSKADLEMLIGYVRALEAFLAAVGSGDKAGIVKAMEGL